MNVINRNPPADVLPPWQARNERDKQALIDFTVGELLDFDAALEEASAGYNGPAHPALRSPKAMREMLLGAAKDAARCFGMLEPLRELYPEIAEFISEPKRKRGVRRPKHPLEKYGEDHTEVVAETVRRVRQIWRERFGRWKCGAGVDNPTVTIVATYLSIVARKLSEAEVTRTLKAMSR